ncbi:MAG: lectin like domain-containing protein [Elusimicrobia bacterium]|nr:lectin like domain-containing protein [Elusimicrobiota bacterium]
MARCGLLLGLTLSLAAGAGAAEPALLLRAAPINPRFLERQRAPRSRPAAVPGGHALGYFPGPLDLSYLKASAGLRPRAAPRAAPASYDLRSLGKVPAIRDQGQCGSCWAFATFGSLESSLLTAETWDFSENNLKNTSGFDYGACGGGWYEMSAAYLARRNGPVSEADDPYDAASSSSPSGLTVRKHVTEMLFLPDRSDASDNAAIKQAVTDYGAVATTIYVTDGFASSTSDADFNAATKAFYEHSANEVNHAVAIVGWDDSYPAANFSTPPPGPGAFIIRNSWGTGWGDSGYFYMSYHSFNSAADSNLTNNIAFNAAQDPASGAYAYQYDSLGWVASYGYGGREAWLAGTFTATAHSETVSQVAFYTTDAGTAYEARLYTGVGSSPVSGTLADTKTGTFAYPGFHTVAVAPTAVTQNQRFSVVVKLSNQDYDYPIAGQYPQAGYSSAATAADGQTFASPDGSSWEDLNQSSTHTHTSACVKAFTTDRIEAVPYTDELKGVRSYPNPARLSEGGQVRFADIPAEAQDVRIEVYTLSGQLVRTLTEGRGVGSDPGRAYKVGLWDGRDENGNKLASGVYVYVVTASNKAKKTAKIGIFW